MARVTLGPAEIAYGDYPAVCMRCGGPGEVAHEQMFNNSPLGIPFLILPPHFFVAAERIGLKVRVCENHKRHWRSRSLFLHLSLLLVFLCCLVGFSLFVGGEKGFLGNFGAILCFAG